MFHRRIDRNFLQIFQRTLTLRIKTADRINLISPQLNSPRILLCKTVNIHNTSADGKLSRHLHLSNPLVSKLYQILFERIHIHGTVTLIMN